MEFELNAPRPRRRKKGYKRRLAAGILAGVLVLSGIGVYFGIDTGFFERAYYEIQNQTNGSIVFESGTYSGETDFGVLSGTGSFRFVTGEYYVGSWTDDQIAGYGTISHPGTGEYEGEFAYSMKNGNGTFTWTNGDRYSGAWVGDTMSGSGVYTFADGGVLEGEFNANQFVSGSHTFENETGSYVVTYQAGVMESAEIVFADGTTYSGACADGLICGYGQIRYPNGDTYQGEYADGVRSGEGTYTWSIGDVYVGTWSGDAMDGTGKYTFNTGEVLNGTFVGNSFASGSYTTTTEAGHYIFTLEKGKPVALEMKLENGLCYDGGFSDSNLNGRGTLTYPSGDEYVGDFVNGVRSGEGTYTWKNGAYYTGAWSDDQMNGRGTYYYSSGSEGYKLVGNFAKNQPNGECTYYISASQSYGTTWQNGRCVKVTE